MKEPPCKKCRRAGQKLFLKGERCFTPKCAMVKKPYVPGMHGRKRRRALSEYGSQLAEKQKLKIIYGITEKQLRKYFKEAAKSRGVATDVLLVKLETRIDNIIFRLGLAESRAKARQIVGHGHVLLNDRKIDIPSIRVEKGDIIKIKKSSLNKGLFKNLDIRLKKFNPPVWLSLDKENWRGNILALPSKEDIESPVDLQMIVEYYSR
ncbi:MAG: 30S ribosomal protein S4 [Candidatus Portnoybacteria bacterium RBG_13_40_8]|uniref:Small ribosomal subunit protein uS4 n=1 Tax=Candidatus Portnoybacteria bacterium RBG_13_40_8 TaxID=1801990 RepID=A0A1G2F3Y1_9BACT|nr:MAG: 30S ribosomal protein S4 [Candidatus Portnoybacteria bacterium RBG_13_40_8]OGZ35202.1 MAG: 30S ribosomal protein S4 [Candidatus Portnoybacteria bacterium RIFCSPHIGHO2_01_FULL_39_19]